MLTIKRQHRAFTLIEVLAALSIIIVLTLALVVTINGQLSKAKQRNVEAMIQTVNIQIEMEYQRDDVDRSWFASENGLVQAAVITDKQLKTLHEGATYQSSATPPRFVLKR